MSDRTVIVKQYLPEWLTEKEPITSLLESLGQDTGQAEDSIKDVLAQCFVDTATWGMKHWEEYLGILVDESKELSSRRGVVKSKLRGAGTTTPALIEATAESYENGNVDVVEFPRQNKVQIKFTDVYGIPPYMSDFDTAINYVIPAHLTIEYLYRYLTWGELDAAGITWADLDAAQLTWAEFEAWNPSQ
ncbi:YmfQ family protein [Dehalobacter sp. DCM]|uniref:putative phage tail protein n=1 Tax=Dehalobacter sp. DCM TaxID=2907827 RepID=UPI00308140F2|nr:YmfQ family protein [Dehalobacter sp. DCM]